MPRQAGLADREPCPWRIVDDVGGAFCMGAIGGGIWHSVRGARLAPSGSRLMGSLTAVQARSPILGGQFAVWGGVFACCDCTISAVRQKEDPWNSIMSGAVTGGVLAARAGPRAMANAAIVGGVLLALIEGMGIMFTKMMAPPVPTAQDYEAAMRQDPTAPPTMGGLGMLQTVMGNANEKKDDELLKSELEPPAMMGDTTSFTSTETESSSSSKNESSSWFSFGSR